MPEFFAEVLASLASGVLYVLGGSAVTALIAWFWRRDRIRRLEEGVEKRDERIQALEQKVDELLRSDPIRPESESEHPINGTEGDPAPPFPQLLVDAIEAVSQVRRPEILDPDQPGNPAAIRHNAEMAVDLIYSRIAEDVCPDPIDVDDLQSVDDWHYALRQALMDMNREHEGRA
ncbi:MAG: hypothetical protein OXI46_03115 [Gemmatimonadota bacterium]|nr:hypothetical protein [Gemmatimonadota bacterium]